MPKRESRSAQRERLIHAAQQVSVPLSCDVCVVGGGASGLVSAITVAEAGASVVVLERDLACGRTILATGNGRCNFANISLDPRRFNDPAFVEAVCGRRWLDDVLRFFKACGLRWCLEDDRLYPVSRQAASVRNVLLSRAREAGVILAAGRQTTRISSPNEAGSQASVSYAPLGTDEGILTASSVILACGGTSAAAVEGIDLAASAPRPALCPLACQDSPLSPLDGRRAHVKALLTKADTFFPCWQERGEVLFRSYGISGIVTFDLSRRAERGDLVELDLAPDLSAGELQQLVDPFAHGTFASGCLDGVLDPAIAGLLEDLARKRWHLPWPEREEPQSDSQALISLVRALPLVVEGPAQPEQAQVMRGGLKTSQFDPSTLGSHNHPWLFACGETLDIDADCGGFNLGWAWKSGMVAGVGAAERARSC